MMKHKTNYKYAKIAISLPMDRIFHYRIPENLRNEVEPGKRVRVEFGRKEMIGYVVGLANSAEVEGVKPIKGVIDKEPIVSAQMLEFAGWMKDTYLCSLGQAVDATVPGVLKKRAGTQRAVKFITPNRRTNYPNIPPAVTH